MTFDDFYPFFLTAFSSSPHFQFLSTAEFFNVKSKKFPFSLQNENSDLEKLD